MGLEKEQTGADVTTTGYGSFSSRWKGVYSREIVAAVSEPGMQWPTCSTEIFMPSFTGWWWDRAFHQCPAGFVNHLFLLDRSVVNIHSCVLPMSSFLDTFTPAVSVSANQKDGVPGSSTYYNLARDSIHCIPMPSTLVGFAPATWSDIWACSESASVEHLMPWDDTGDTGEEHGV